MVEFYLINAVDNVNISDLIAIVLISAAVLLPFAISFYKVKQNLRQEQGRILFKVPSSAATVALISSTIAIVASWGVAIILDLNHLNDMLVVLWVLLIGPSYILVTAGVGFLLCLVVYFWIKFTDTSTQNQVITSEIKQTVQKTRKKNTIFQTLKQIFEAIMLGFLALYILRNTDLLGWLLG